MNMSIENLFALFAVFVSFLLFLQLGIAARRRQKTNSDYLFAGRNIKGILFQNTLIAGGTSLATVLAFFLTQAAIYGWAFLVNIVSFVIGQYMFFWLVRKSQIEIGSFSTLSRLIQKESNSNIAANLFRITTLTTFFAILFIELIFGSVVFEFIFPGQHTVLIFSIISCLIIFTYLVLGGFAATVESDSWQAKIIYAAAFALILFLVFSYKPTHSLDFTPVFSPSVYDFVIYSLIINAIIVNFTLPFCQLNSWHRIAAVGNWEVIDKNYRQGLLKYFVLWGIFAIFAFITLAGGDNLTDFNDVFEKLKANGGIAAFVIFPLFFAGLVSAMLSTADTAAMAIVLEVADAKAEIDGELSEYKGFYIITLAVILLSVGVASYALNSEARDAFVHILFLMFSQLVVFFPLVLSAAFKKIDFSPLGWKLTWLGALLGLIAVWGVSIYGYSQSSVAWTQFSSAVGISIAFLFFAIAMFCCKIDQVGGEVAQNV